MTRQPRSWSRWPAASGPCAGPACSPKTPWPSSASARSAISSPGSFAAPARPWSAWTRPRARRTLARQLGVDALAPEAAAAAIAELSEGRGADHVILTGGAAQGLKWGVGVVRDGGSLHCFAGGPEPALPLGLDALYHRELTVTATYSSSPADLAEAFQLVAGGAIALDGLYTHRLPLERLDEGVQLMRSHDALKVYVTP